MDAMKNMNKIVNQILLKK